MVRQSRLDYLFASGYKSARRGEDEWDYPEHLSTEEIDAWKSGYSNYKKK